MGRLARQRLEMAARRARPRPEVPPAPEPDAAGPALQLLSLSISDPVVGGGNNDGWIQPGETVQVQVRLHNTGNSPAQGVYGQLNLAEVNPYVTIPDKNADWPNIAVQGMQTTDSPHFQVTISNLVPCGATIPFSLVVNATGGYTWTLALELPLRRLEPVDVLEDAARRSNESDVVLYGADDNDIMGVALALGDVNGDGFDDLLMGAQWADGLGNGNPFAGEVRLVYGSSTGLPPVLDMATDPPGTVMIYSTDSDDYLGTSVAAGDLNGDGYDDLILGAASGDGPGNGRSNAGDVYVIYGQASMLSGPLSVQASAKAIHGPTTSDELGSAVAAGDVNGDGYDDLVASAPWADGPAARSSAGQVWVIHGSPAQLPSSTDLATPPAASTVVYGADVGDALGGHAGGTFYHGSIAAGDVNGDGRDDLALTAWPGDGLSNARPSSGEAWIVLGQPSPGASIDLAAPPAGTVFVSGAGTGDVLTAAATGDLDGDGYADVLLSAPFGAGPGNTRTNAGEAYVIPGSATLPATIDLASPPAGSTIIYGVDNDRLGYEATLASADTNGDGYDDLLVGEFAGDPPSRPDAGTVYVIAGGASGLPPVIDLASPGALARSILGGLSFDSLSTCAGGDINGDGFDDVVVGAYNAEPAGKSSTGQVDLVLGAATTTYWHKTESFSFIDASGGTNLNLACDDCSTAFPIGFEFRFYGEKFTTVYVSSNGFVSFQPIQDPISAATRCIDSKNPSSLSSVPLLIAPFWDDLDLRSSGAVYALLSGVAPNRRLTIEWSNVPHYPGVGAGTFEVSLYESTGQILMQYQDVTFGTTANNGGTAVVGTQNRTAAAGTNFSCNQALLGSSVAVSFNAATPLFVDNMESLQQGFGPPSKLGKWTKSAGAMWVAPGTCTPYHGRTQAWENTQGGCTYNTGTAGDLLTSPTIGSFPADGRFTGWRNVNLTDALDIATGTSLASGGPTVVHFSQAGPVNTGLTYAPYFLGSAFAGFNYTLEFKLQSDAFGFLGTYMVDDVKILGCNAVGISTLAGASAFADPVIYCGDGVNTGKLDAVGSGCGDGSNPTGYQWLENGTPIPGATQVTYTIPAGHPAGTFDFAVVVTCAGGSATSAPVSVQIVAPPPSIGNTFRLAKQGGGAAVQFTWIDVCCSTQYDVFEDLAASGTFSTLTGTAVTGVTGLTTSMPPGSLVFYKVAGENPTCGVGPK